jgi:ankyrin repeat protein
MRLIKYCFLLFTASLTVSQTCASQTTPTPTIQKEQIALWDAVIAGNVTEAIASLKAGADVNGLDTRENVAGPNGRRPLNYAALRNDTAMITALLDAGAMINLANRSGFTPLHHAAEAGSEEAAALLIAKGANVTLRNLHNQTPMETATASHHPAVAEVLRRATKTSK